MSWPTMTDQLKQEILIVRIKDHLRELSLKQLETILDSLNQSREAQWKILDDGLGKNGADTS